MSLFVSYLLYLSASFLTLNNLRKLYFILNTLSVKLLLSISSDENPNFTLLTLFIVVCCFFYETIWFNSFFTIFSSIFVFANLFFNSRNIYSAANIFPPLVFVLNNSTLYFIMSFFISFCKNSLSACSLIFLPFLFSLTST